MLQLLTSLQAPPGVPSAQSLRREEKRWERLPGEPGISLRHGLSISTRCSKGEGPGKSSIEDAGHTAQPGGSWGPEKHHPPLKWGFTGRLGLRAVLKGASRTGKLVRHSVQETNRKDGRKAKKRAAMPVARVFSCDLG